ncbi:MAG: hypothetical protein RBS68_11560 [Anaerolineales bacterium]|jgi:hypothetical protein|nr:hypothetical protein [Anaerolineales bacterium]
MVQARTTHAGKVEIIPNGWRLEIEEGGPSAYRLAQVDDYALLARRRFIWRERATLKLGCRVSQPNLPGTWGFGFWNDPFTVSFGLQGMARRLPVLPNACWFFHASPENHLSFTNGQPASGFLAQTFSSPRIPSGLLAPGVLGLPLLLLRPLSRWLRTHLAAKLIREDAKRLSVDVTEWHEYSLSWQAQQVQFAIDGETVFETATSPKGPLGLVIWIDNQYAAWRPDGSLGMGALATPRAWMDVELDNETKKDDE